MEPYLLKVLELVKSAPERRPEFAQCFLECVNQTENPCELLVFCMRELQWAEVREAVERKIDVLEFCEDEWEDADLWRYYEEKL